MLGENDNLAVASGEAYSPSKKALFIPVVIISIGYAVFFAWLWANGNAGTGVARLSLLVLAVGVPLLVAHAVLRLFTTHIRLQPDGLHINTGFPRAREYEVPYRIIRNTVIKRGLAGRMLDAGTVVLQLTTGQKISVCDLEHPEQVRAAVERRIDDQAVLDPEGDVEQAPVPAAASDR